MKRGRDNSRSITFIPYTYPIETGLYTIQSEISNSGANPDGRLAATPNDIRENHISICAFRVMLNSGVQTR